MYNNIMADIERSVEGQPIVTEARPGVDAKTPCLRYGESIAQMTDRVMSAWGANIPTDVKNKLIRMNKEDREDRHQRVLGSSNPALVSGQKDRWFENPNNEI